MKYYTDLTLWGNANRQTKLTLFRNMVVNYFNELDYDTMGDPILTEKVLKTRFELNKMSSMIGMITRSAGINPVIKHFSPPAMGRHVTNIDVISNIFNLRPYNIAPLDIIDILDKAIGIYEQDRYFSIIRTFNPIFWLSQLFAWITTIPFRLLAYAGFDAEQIKETTLGKLINLTSQLLITIGTALTILQILGYTDLISTIKLGIDGIF